MKSRLEVSDEKLRGGFYSPPDLVTFCLNRIRALATGRSGLHLLEPSAGDGAFFRGLESNPLSRQLSYATAIEPLWSEANVLQGVLANASFPSEVVVESAIEWSLTSDRRFDVAVGNPPFVRFQFLEPETKTAISTFGETLGVSYRRVSNLWMPILMLALAKLETNGVFAFIIPAEAMTGISAGTFREWLVTEFSDLQIDLFAPGSFPDVLQEIVVLSGKRIGKPQSRAAITVVDCDSDHEFSRWTRTVESSPRPWTHLILTPSGIGALEEAMNLPLVRRLGEFAKFGVSTVTGANDYFSVDTETLSQWELTPWARPLLPRIRHARGLVYGTEDHLLTTASGAKTHLLHFDDPLPDPEQFALPSAYLGMGEEWGLAARFKCRIRDPWYRVPVVPSSELLLSKRSHRFPRIVVNDANVVTTDTIYLGRPLTTEYSALDIAAVFHNSLSMLSAELEGRSFGGGVLELVPSEVGRLLLPKVPNFGENLSGLDHVARVHGSDSDDLIDATDQLIARGRKGLTRPLLDRLREARGTLLQRRLDRNAL